MEPEDLVKQTAALRGAREYKQALRLIDANMPARTDDLWVNVNIEGLRAAEEGGDSVRATEFARRIAEEEPKLPSIQKYL